MISTQAAATWIAHRVETVTMEREGVLQSRAACHHQLPLILRSSDLATRDQPFDGINHGIRSDSLQVFLSPMAFDRPTSLAWDPYTRVTLLSLRTSPSTTVKARAPSLVSCSAMADPVPPQPTMPIRNALDVC